MTPQMHTHRYPHCHPAPTRLTLPSLLQRMPAHAQQLDCKSWIAGCYIMLLDPNCHKLNCGTYRVTCMLCMKGVKDKNSRGCRSCIVTLQPKLQGALNETMTSYFPQRKVSATVSAWVHNRSGIAAADQEVIPWKVWQSQLQLWPQRPLCRHSGSCQSS